MFGFIQMIFGWAAMAFHPFYISMTDINYNDKAKTLEVSVRIFTDDFEKALRKNCNCKIDLIHPSDRAAMDRVASAYILKHLQVKVDGQIKNLAYSGYQQEDESTWNYFTIKDINSIKKIEIVNSLLHDYRDEQINMLHVKANGREQSDKLDFPERNYSVVY